MPQRCEKGIKISQQRKIISCCDNFSLHYWHVCIFCRCKPIKSNAQQLQPIHTNLNEDLRQELLEQINELLHFRGDSCDLYQAFDDLLLDYGFDGDPTELLYELM